MGYNKNVMLLNLNVFSPINQWIILFSPNSTGTSTKAAIFSYIRMRKTTSSRWIAKALCDLCFEFDAEFSAAKREENLLDFADLEHFALELLDKEDIRTAVSSRYKYVFADEYQDVNGVQEEILHRINSGNTFMAI